MVFKLEDMEVGSSSGYLCSVMELPKLSSLTHSHFILSYEFMVRNLSGAGLDNSSAPGGVGLGHVVVFNLGLSWIGGSMKASFSCLNMAGRPLQPGSLPF